MINPPVMSAVLHEVIGTNMIGAFRSVPDAGAVIQPEPPALSLLRRHFQPFTLPDPFDAPVAHMPARLVE